VDSLTHKTYVKTPNLSLQHRSRWSYIGYKGAAAILNVYCPTFAMSTQFFNLLWPSTTIRSQN